MSPLLLLMIHRKGRTDAKKPRTSKVQVATCRGMLEVDSFAANFLRQMRRRNAVKVVVWGIWPLRHRNASVFKCFFTGIWYLAGNQEGACAHVSS